MTREQYIHIRQNNQVPLELLYEYYIDNCTGTPACRDMSTFAQSFQMYAAMQSPDLSHIIKQYDIKFKVNILNDKNGNIVKVY
jgi:hypothetical protein